MFLKKTGVVAASVFICGDIQTPVSVEGLGLQPVHDYGSTGTTMMCLGLLTGLGLLRLCPCRGADGAGADYAAAGQPGAGDGASKDVSEEDESGEDCLALCEHQHGLTKERHWRSDKRDGEGEDDIKARGDGGVGLLHMKVAACKHHQCAMDAIIAQALGSFTWSTTVGQNKHLNRDDFWIFQHFSQLFGMELEHSAAHNYGHYRKRVQSEGRAVTLPLPTPICNFSCGLEVG